MPQDALPVDHKSHPPGDHAKRLLHAIKLAHRAAFIGQQGKGKLVFPGELPVRFAGIAADAQNLRSRLAELRNIVAKPASLKRASTGVVLRIEVDDHRLSPPKFTQADGVSILIREFELGCRSSVFQWLGGPHRRDSMSSISRSCFPVIARRDSIRLSCAATLEASAPTMPVSRSILSSIVIRLVFPF